MLSRLFFVLTVFAAATISVLPAQTRQVTIEGKLVNLLDYTGNFPLGNDFSLTLTLDETVPDSIGSPFSSRFSNSIIDADLMIDGIYSATGATFTGSKVEVDTDTPYLSPSVLAEFSFSDSSTGDTFETTVNFYQNIGSPPTTDLITQDLSTSSFRLIEVLISPELNVGAATNFYLGGVGWARAAGVPAGGVTPDPVRKVGYDHPVILGDSLSESQNAGPSNPAKVFNGGNTNGPVWVEYLSWLMGMNFEETLNFSAFGNFDPPLPAELEGYAFDNALGIYWTHNTIYQSILTVAFSDPPQEFFDSMAVTGQAEFLRGAEMFYAMGVRDLLALNTADISFAPLAALFIPTGAKQTQLIDFVDDIRPDMQTYFDDWFSGLFPGMRTTVWDPGVYLADLRAAPAAYGITNLSGTHLSTDADSSTGPTPFVDYFGNPGSTYFFWDDTAPTTKVHGTLADRLFDDVFNTGDFFDNALRSRLIKVTDDELWIFGSRVPSDRLVTLRQDLGPLTFNGGILQSFMTNNGNVFFVEPRPASNKAFYILEAADP